MPPLVRERIGILLLLIFLNIFLLFPDVWADSVCEEEKLCVVFFDVGQGDAIFIQSPSGMQMLVDAGADASVLRELSTVLKSTDRHIDYLLMTHPDSDHVGGFPEVFDRYAITHLIRTNNRNDGPLGVLLEEKERAEGLTLHLARRGQRYDLGSGVWIEVLFPDRDVRSAETNTASIIAKLTFGSHSFLFTGDAPKSIEEYLVLTHGDYLESTVLKVGHHGSRTSTSELFLDEVQPKIAVISAGADNPYGHPHQEVTNALEQAGVTLYQTGLNGQVVLHSDGEVLEQPKSHPR